MTATTKPNPSEGGSYTDDGSGPVRVNDAPSEAPPVVVAAETEPAAEPTTEPIQETA